MSTARARLAAQLLADSRLPSGAYAHSAGLEAAQQAGAGVDAVRGYMSARLATTARTDAAAAALALRTARIGIGSTGLGRIDRAVAARTPSEPMRAASRQLGRGLLRIGARLADGDALVAELAGRRVPPMRPVALGAVGSALGLDETEVASITCYEEAQSIASAALKLYPIDPATAATWVLDCADEIEVAVTAAVDVAHPDALPAWSAPFSEIWLQTHSQERRRLFVS